MVRKKSVIVLLCICFLLSGASGKQLNGDTGKTVVKGQLGEKIDDYLKRLSGFGYSGVMLVAKDGQIIFRKGYGMANEAANVPNTPETVFDIGSLAKQFTATAILTLESQGKLKVSDPISLYLPAVPKDKSAITIDQLLTHTAGMDGDFPLADPGGEYYEEVNRTDAVRRILEMPLIDEPGKAYSYSNVGYILLAAIVEEVAQRPFRDFLRASIFEPVGMRHTGFWGNELPPVKDSLIAHCYDETRETGDPHKWSPATWVDMGGGEIVSTVGDLYKWYLALNSDRILSPAAKQKMFTPRLNDYGYGWYIQKTPRGTTVIQHGGDYFGFGSQVSWFRDENVLMINLANRSNQLFGVRHVADRLVPQIIFGAKEYHMFKDDEFEFPPISTLPGQALIKQVPGTYQLETGGRLVIGLEQDRLYIGAWGQDAVNAIANASADEFRRRDMLNDRAKRIYEGVARGDRKALPAEWLRPGGPLEEYADAMQSSWKQFIKENGRLKSIEIVGTVPGVYPVGIQHTSVRLNYENGHVDRQLHWVNDRIIGISQEPPLLAKTSLRAGPKTGLVGWSMIWFKGFQLSFEFAAEHAKTLILQTPGRTIRAKLVSTQFS